MATSSDYAPFFQSSIGFDRIFDLLENAQRLRAIDDWPPYDIIKTGENNYRITLAVPGFSHDELSITYQSRLLTIEGNSNQSSAEDYLHRGIAGRPFEHRFELADHVEVAGAKLSDGLLSIDLVQELPAAAQPRVITIQTEAGGPPARKTRQINDQKAA